MHAAVFTIPFQISAVFFESPAWGTGFFNPYAVVEFYLFETLILLSSLSFFVHRFKSKKQLKTGHLSYYAVVLAWWFLILLSLALNPINPAFSLAVAAHSGIFILLYFLIVNQVVEGRELMISFIASLCFQSLLGVYQFVTQSSLGLYALGEPFLSPDLAHLARMNVAGHEFVRAYGTLPHPNVLGGFLSLSMIGTFFLTIKQRGIKMTLLSVQFLGLMLTFSRSALLSLSISLLVMAILYRSEIKRHSKKLINTAVFVVGLELMVVILSRLEELSQSTGERVKGIMTAFALFEQYPLGVGYRLQTLFLDQAAAAPLMPWDYQPVHNIYLLMLSELGIFGLLLGAWFFIFSILKLYDRRKLLLTRQRLQKKRLLISAILIIALIGLFDHYWLSLSQGVAVLIFFLALASSFSVDPGQVQAIKKGGSLKQSPIDPSKNL